MNSKIISFSVFALFLLNPSFANEDYFSSRTEIYETRFYLLGMTVSDGY
jgi:hypothetical protein